VYDLAVIQVHILSRDVDDVNFLQHDESLSVNDDKAIDTP
jgi:hypothetical protein